jgi:hypothetical protein
VSVFFFLIFFWAVGGGGVGVAYWLRHGATSRTVSG